MSNQFKTNNFGDIFPTRNLGEGTPWGRHVESRILGLERGASSTDQRVRNENRILSAKAEIQAEQTNRLSEQQGHLLEQQELISQQQGKLEGHQSQLEKQQSELSSQQANLEHQQVQLANLVNAIPVTSTHSGTANGFSVPSGNRNQISVTVPVPAGKTRASVFVIGQALFFAEGVSQAGIAGWSAVISGNAGSPGNNVPLNMDGKSTSFSHVRSFAVTPGGSFTIIARSSAGENHGSNLANNALIHATATFTN